LNKSLVNKIPSAIRRRIYKPYLYLKDRYQVYIEKRNPMVPPEWKIFVGGGNFEKIGNAFFQYFKELGQLKPNEKVLDIGCGQGRMAIPLTSYLQEGQYEGLDIVEQGIKWCKKKITTKHKNFNFQLADVYNRYYNPTGKCKSSEYTFPYPDASFDFIFLTSVFTHMLPSEVENYLKETSRVLKSRGRCIITWFILNEETKKLIAENQSKLNFKYEDTNYATVDKSLPEAGVGFNESYVTSLYEKNGLSVIQPFYFGNWCGRKDFLDHQDIILAIKK